MDNYLSGYVVNIYDRAGFADVTYTTSEDHISEVMDIIVDALKALTFAEETIVRGLQSKAEEMKYDSK